MASNWASINQIRNKSILALQTIEVKEKNRHTNDIGERTTISNDSDADGIAGKGASGKLSSSKNASSDDTILGATTRIGSSDDDEYSVDVDSSP